ncbi:S41 family peptidase [Marinicella sp. W31]|uniref:S41 family peptidase n=1 Tax=Marinicella sp. W31 TaxID=3023713 RepID=UPI0037568672
MNKIILMLCLCLTWAVSVADETKIEQAFEHVLNLLLDQQYETIEPHLADTFQVGGYDGMTAAQILPQILSQLPPLRKLEIKNHSKTESGYEMVLNYQLHDEEPGEFVVGLNDAFKIVSMQLFDNFVAQSSLGSKAQKAEDTDLNSVPFLTVQQLADVYDLLIEKIEQYDMEGIHTRNLKKRLNWNTYKKLQKKIFIESDEWQTLARNFEEFGSGFVNLHSNFEFNKSIQSELKKTAIELGFTYPEILFFLTDSKQRVTAINGQPIWQAFQHFEDFACPFNSTIGCLSHFTYVFKTGQLWIEGMIPSDVSTPKAVIPVVYETRESVDRMARHKERIQVDGYEDWELLAHGLKVAVWKQSQTVLIKIKSFVYFGGRGGGYRCEEPADENTMCADIQLIRTTLDNLKSEDYALIIDLQDNGGGNENTPFLAELSQHPFEDLRVIFRNSDLLHDDTLRQYMFYGNQRAEDWYAGLTDEQKDLSHAFLPARADFCQGDVRCTIKPIQPNKQRAFKKITILTNQNCVSSCDDFVWRMQDYSNAFIVGLPNAADATYSRIDLVFYLDKDGQPTVVPFGQNPPDFEGTKLFTVTIPYSKTVKASGEVRQGVPADLNLMVPVTVDNYATHDKAVLKQVMAIQ